MNFKKNFRAELDYLDLTVKELSAQTGIAKGTLDCYLGIRESMPPADVAVKIAHALGVSVEYLVTGNEIRREITLTSLSPGLRSLVQAIEPLPEADRNIILSNALNLVEILKGR